MNIRYIFWGIAIASLGWDFVNFIHNLVEAADPSKDYPTNFDAFSYLISGIFSSFQYFFYAELYHLLKTKLKKREETHA